MEDEHEGDEGSQVTGAAAQPGAVPTTTANGTPTGTATGSGVQLPGDEPGGTNNVGKNGIAMKWPIHPGEYGVKGADKHKQWKNKIKAVMWMKNIDEKSRMTN